MDYVELNIPINSVEEGEILMAELADYPFESFESEGNTLLKGTFPKRDSSTAKGRLMLYLRDTTYRGHGLSRSKHKTGMLSGSRISNA
ncbi:MAG: hypothetical protein SNI46_04700 [Rikenellaceae bacterium]